MRLPTVKIKKGNGFAIINERDFDPAKHRRYDEAQAQPRKRGRPRKAVTDGA
jgi:hypothetical protein